MLLLVVPAVLLATGCSGLTERLAERIAGTESRSDALVREAGRTESVGRAATSVIYDNGLYIAKSSVRLPQQVKLPEVFHENATFDRSVRSLSEFAERITVRSGIACKVTPDAQAAALRTLSGGQAATPGAGQPPGLVASAGPGAPLQQAGSGAVTEIRIVYPSGSLKGLLDTAASRFGVSWKYVDGVIQFHYLDTRTFQITAIPGDSATSATVASGSSSDATGGGTNVAGSNANNSQNTAVVSRLSVFGSIEKSILAMLTPSGQVVASPATGTITVTDTPDSLERVAQYITSENRALARQVMISVTVLSVSVNNGDSLGLNWNLVYGDLFRKYGISNTYTSDPGASSFSAAILNTANSKFAGTSVIIDALATQGRVRKETTASVATLNNQPVPVQVAKQTSYLKSSQSTNTANVGSTTTLTPGTVTSGFNMTVLPHVLNNGTVMLQFSTDMSNLRRIRSVTSDRSTIETPELDTRNFLQRVAMKSGETLVISGFEQVEDGIDQQGVGNPANFLLGGGRKSSASKEVIVILVTPIMMNGA
ncbi:MAG TPA: PilN family type IVB pilus formation outer membrane protein [Albitalea sp.]